MKKLPVIIAVVVIVAYVFVWNKQSLAKPRAAEAKATADKAVAETKAAAEAKEQSENI